jgi:hypothetical protein
LLERIEAVKNERIAIIKLNEKRSGRRSNNDSWRPVNATADQIAKDNAEKTSRLLEMVTKTASSNLLPMTHRSTGDNIGSQTI